MFPLDHRGEFTRSKVTINDPENFSGDFFERATGALAAVGARDISVNGHRISFTGGMFRFVWNWNILIQIGYGYVDLTETDDSFVISYYASFREMLVIVSMLVLIFGVDLFVSDKMPLAGKLGLLSFAWIFLFGGNWVIAIARFPSFVNNMLWAGDRI